MCTSMLPCPLCSLPRFSDLESLRIGLIKVATENLVCPICNDIFMGLDKLTIHLFSHCDSGIFKPDKSIHDNRQKKDKSTRMYETQSENYTQIPSVESSFSKLPKPKHKTTHLNLVEGSELLKNTNKSSHMMPVYNINTIPFIGIPENLSILQRNKKNIRSTTTTEKAKNNKLSEKCDICGFCFLGKNILEMHKKLIHNVQNSEIVNGVSKYCCNLCSKVFKMRGSLMVHLRMVHFGIIPSIKSDEDSSQTALRSVPTTCDEPNFETTINSEVINTECNAKHDFEALITNSTSPEGQDIFHNNNNGISQNNATKQWTCDICKKQFTTKYFLKKHKRLHTGEMPYACNQCNKTFTFQQSYHKHLLYHNDDKPHQCSQCGRAFKELSTLHNHQRIHTGEKPFSCETCGKCFRQRVSYLVHRRIHTGAMPYKCTACEKSFRYKVSQRTHKCTVQPPGTLVRQSGGDLVQKLIKNQKETQNIITNSPGIEDTDREAINRETKFSQHFTFDSRRNSNHDSQNDNHFLEKLCHNVQHSLTDDLICNENLRPKDVQEREEKNIIDELVSESILKMDFSHPGPSTSQKFCSGVTDLYSMISLQDDTLEDSLPSPSEKFKNLKLSPSSDNLTENGSVNNGIYEKSVQPQGYRISHSNSIDSFVKSKSDGDYGVNDSQLYDSIYQRR